MRTVVVTGAGSGIGRATVLRLLRDGDRVIAVDLDPVRLAELATEAGDALLVPVAGDITDPGLPGLVLDAAGDRVDGLANVAGIMDGFLPAAEVDDATWERVLAVNLTGPMRLTRAVLPGMVAAGRGAIVNVASEAALRPSTAGAAYTASKHAITGYTRNVAFFYGPQGVRANVVAPGPVITNIDGGMRSEHAARRAGPVLRATMTPPVPPEQPAAAIAWLLSDEATNINGVVLPSDGGWSVA